MERASILIKSWLVRVTSHSSVRLARNLGPRVEAGRSCRTVWSAPHAFNFRVVQGYAAKLGSLRIMEFDLIANPKFVV